MRVTIEHSEETAGLTGGQKNFFVNGEILFSEEERAIIEARKLHNTPVVSGYIAPPIGLAKAVSPAFGGFGPLLMIGGFIYGLMGGGNIAGLILFGGFALWIYGYVGPYLHSAKHDERVFTVATLLKDSHIKLYAPNPSSAKTIDDDIRENLAGLKALIADSRDLRAKETFEL